MAKRKILVAGNPMLRKRSEEVDKLDKKTLRLLSDMAETMYAADGVGLAAPQIGVLKRMVVIDTGEEEGMGLLEFINPVITKKEGSITMCEGCLSVPDYEGEVERAEKVECTFFDRSGKQMLLEAEGILAVAVQHEIDHLDGVLFIDKASAILPKPKEEEVKETL